MNGKSDTFFDFSSFGHKIKALRIDQGLSRKQLSDRLGVSERHIARIENEGQHPSLELLFALSAIFDLSVDDYFF